MAGRRGEACLALLVVAQSMGPLPQPGVGAPLAAPCWWSPNLRVRYPSQAEACLAPTHHYFIMLLMFIIAPSAPYRIHLLKLIIRWPLLPRPLRAITGD